MTRIIAGTLKGRSLKVPQSVTRPTSSRVREALFSTIQSWAVDFDGVAVLDLFAGSGALGIELLSRGATRAVCVERDARAANVIRENVRELQIDRVTVVNDDTIRFLDSATDGPFDIVIADPPYAFSDTQIEQMLESLVVNNWLSDVALVVVERSSRSQVRWPSDFSDIEHRTYGDTALWYGQYRTQSRGAQSE